jgi:hypothetical protein
MHAKIQLESLKGNYYFGRHGHRGGIILKCMLQKYGLDRIYLTQDLYWALVNMLMNLHVPQKVGSFLNR